MKAGTLLLLIHDEIEAMVASGVIDVDGDLQAPKDYALLTTKVLEALKNRGIVIPEKADKIIRLIPLILDIVDDF